MLSHIEDFHHTPDACEHGGKGHVWPNLLPYCGLDVMTVSGQLAAVLLNLGINLVEKSVGSFEAGIASELGIYLFFFIHFYY